jgi:uncharacterized membrane protein YedE/YeeE
VRILLAGVSLGLVLFGLLGVCLDRWVWTAPAIGFFLGGALQQSHLCGASVLSAVVLDRDWRGVQRAGLVVVVSMLGLVFLSVFFHTGPDALPVHVFPVLAGGLVFGAGSVMAGGCVSGTLYKVGEGRVSSVFALIGICVGANAAGPGCLGSLRGLLGETGPLPALPAGMHHLLGLSFPGPALVIAIVFLVSMFYARRKTVPSAMAYQRPGWINGWSTVQAGFVMGLVMLLAYVCSLGSGRNHLLCVSAGVQQGFGLVVGSPSLYSPWLIMVAWFVIPGSALSAWVRGQWKLRTREPKILLIAFAGGILTGLGATLGAGCFLGHFLSGLSSLSLHSVLFVIMMVLSNWITTLLYLRGPK